MKFKILLFLLLLKSSFPNILFAQWMQQGPKLTGGNQLTSGYFGQAVSISSDGNTAVVGAYGDDNETGAILIFTRINGTWSQQGPKLVGTGYIGNAIQGISVAISGDGNTVVEGGYQDNGYIGAAWIFTRSNGVWSQQGPKLIGTGAVGNAQQGYSVAISAGGNTVALGGLQDNGGLGAVWIFSRSGSVWSQAGPKLIGTGSVGVPWIGYSTGLSGDGNTLVVGGMHDNNEIGACWVFVNNSGTWSQQGPKLIGNDLVGYSLLGRSIAISANGNTFVIGGPNDHILTGDGAIWIFVRNNNVWSQQGPKLVGTNGYYGFQGTSVSISSDGNVVIEGGFDDNNMTGAIWPFVRNGTSWSQLGQKLVGTGSTGNADQGISVDISSDGSTFIEGGPVDNGSGGAVWVFYNATIGIQPISNEVPKTFSLSQNYPNPFNPSTTIKFDIPKAGNVSLNIYDITGKEVYYVSEFKAAGQYEFSFDASNYTSGLYFYKLESGTFSETKKMVLIK